MGRLVPLNPQAWGPHSVDALLVFDDERGKLIRFFKNFTGVDRKRFSNLIVCVRSLSFQSVAATLYGARLRVLLVPAIP